jgi:hypothetical protein
MDKKKDITKEPKTAFNVYKHINVVATILSNEI